jgi:hypothetical protein
LHHHPLPPGMLVPLAISSLSAALLAVLLLRPCV